MNQQKKFNKNSKYFSTTKSYAAQSYMYWPTDESQQNNVQHQNGLRQENAMGQQSYHQKLQYSTPPPPIQRRHPRQQQYQSKLQYQPQQQYQDQQEHQQQYDYQPKQERPQQQSSLLTAPHLPSHYCTNQSPPSPYEWTTMPPTLNGPSFIQQCSTTAPHSTQYCASTPQYFQPNYATQATEAPVSPEQVSRWVPGSAVYTMPPTLVQPPPASNIAITSAQQMQFNYFPTSHYYQPPLGKPTYGHTIPLFVKHRKYALPIIDPTTIEETILTQNIVPESPTAMITITLNPLSKIKDLDESENDLEEDKIPEKEISVQEKCKKGEEYMQNIEENLSDPTTQPSLGPYNVEFIVLKEEFVEDLRREDIEVNENDAIMNIVEENQVEVNDKQESTAYENLLLTSDVVETAVTSSKAAETLKMVDKENQRTNSPITMPNASSRKKQRQKDNQKKIKKTYKIANYNDKQTMTEPYNSNRAKKAIETSDIITKVDEMTKEPKSLDDQQKTEQSSDKAHNSRGTSKSNDDSSQTGNSYSPQPTKFGQGMVPQKASRNEKVNVKNPLQEISLLIGNECRKDSEEKEDYSSSTVLPENKYTYTLQYLKSLVNLQASNQEPKFKGRIHDLIAKHTKGAAWRQMYHHISMNASENKQSDIRMKNAPPYQQFRQQPHNIIRLNLFLNEEIELAKSENAWVPAGLQNDAPKYDSEDDEHILKKIRGILNKLTPENFDKLLQSAANFSLTGGERINKVMLLIFEKTLREPNFSSTYARFCKFLFNTKDHNRAMFKTILLNRIQLEFESNVNNAKAKNDMLRPILDRLAVATDPKEKLDLKAELDDQEFQFRRRAWGTVHFIGEMFKLGMLSHDRVCMCVENLLDRRCEGKLECMCKLLTTVGEQLEPIEQQPDKEKSILSVRLDKTFKKIKQLVETRRSTDQKISSRVRFMMQDVVELRARCWDQVVVPTTTPPQSQCGPQMAESEKRTQKRDVRKKSSYPHREVSTSSTVGSPHSQRSKNSMQSDEYEIRKGASDRQSDPKQVNIDVNKLPLFCKDEIPRKLGPSHLMWKVVGRSQQQPQQPSTELRESKESTTPKQEELSNGECERLLNGLVEVVIEEESKKEWFAKWEKIASVHHSQIVYHLLTEYLHLAKVKRPEIEACTRLFTSLLKENLLSLLSFNEGYQKFAEVWENILVDVPMGWQYVFNIIGPLLHLEVILFDSIWVAKWFNTQVGFTFLQSMIIHFTSDYGANYMRFFWDNNSLHWDTFMTEERVTPFITKNRFGFIENDKYAPPIFIRRNTDELVQRIEGLLSQSDRGIDLIIDFISTNVHIDCDFIRTLTVFICDYAVFYCSTPRKKLSNTSPNSATTTTSYKLRENLFITKCIPLLRFCINSKNEHELSCLDALVERCTRMYDSSADDLICAMLKELYGKVIAKESLETWHQEQQMCAEDKITICLNTLFEKLNDYLHRVIL